MIKTFTELALFALVVYFAFAMIGNAINHRLAETLQCWLCIAICAMWFWELNQP
jgi:hypothetical protein